MDRDSNPTVNNGENITTSPDPRWPNKSRWSGPVIATTTSPNPINPQSPVNQSVNQMPSTSVALQPSLRPLLRMVRSLSLDDLEYVYPSESESSFSDESIDPKEKVNSSAPDATVITPEEKVNSSAADATVITPDLVQSQHESDESPNQHSLMETTEPVVVSSPSSPSCHGAWANPLLMKAGPETPLFSSKNAHIASSDLWPPLKDSAKVKSKRQLGNEEHVRSFSNVLKGTQKRVETMEDDFRFPWAAKMNPGSRNLYRASEPEYLPDGTPKVIIPRHVFLKGLENQKEYIIGQFYRCLPPPGGLIHAVFNKLWGRKCRITVRKLGESSYLYHIPDESTRSWVLQRGLWHVDDCLMFVAPWTPEASLAIPVIKTIPVWVTLKKIPNNLYSIPGISHIASGLGAPMATDKPILDPFLMGKAKILVEVELSKAFPTRIAAGDENGLFSMVDVEYAWIPTNCRNCGQLGHKEKRCLQPTLGSQSKVDTIIQSSTEKVAETSIENATSNEHVVAIQSSTPIQGSSIEVPLTNVIFSPAGESKSTENAPHTFVGEHFIPPKISTAENVSISKVNKVIPSTIESPLQEAAQFTTVKSHAKSHATLHVGSNIQPEIMLGSNQFASLASSEGAEVLLDSDSEIEFGLMEKLTPTGKRILRERPVKPSAKAKEIASETGRGRGRGRGRRGGRG